MLLLLLHFPKENKAGKIDNFMSKNRIKEQKKSAKILEQKWIY